jgi:CubicO group peptidase (beta-lactamase class C family)
MTKVATATLTMRVVAAGQLSLDTPVRDVLGARTPMSWGHRVRIRHLLSHSGGVRNPLPLRWVHPAAGDPVDLDAFVDRVLARHGRLRFEPGTRGRYSNLGILVLGAVLKAVTATAFDDLMRSGILGPLEMSATDFAFPAGGSPPAVGHHRTVRAGTPLVRALVPRSIGLHRSGRFLVLDQFYVDGAPYGGLVGHVLDAARFLSAHVPGSGTELISDDVRNRMQSIDVPGRPYSFGLGWFTTPDDHRESTPCVRHLGGGLGYYNVFRLWPRAQVGVVVIGNATRYAIDDLTRRIRRLVNRS